jgi:hypothetical protein
MFFCVHCSSRKLSQRMPVTRELETLRRDVIVNCLHLERRKTNPFVAGWATANETAPLPPRADQRLINSCRIAVELKFEVDPLHVMRAARVRTRGFIIVDVGQRHGAESTFTIEAIQCFQLSRRDRRCFEHGPLPCAGGRCARRCSTLSLYKRGHAGFSQTRFFSSCMLRPRPRISLVKTSKLAGVPASSVFSPLTMLS